MSTAKKKAARPKARKAAVAQRRRPAAKPAKPLQRYYKVSAAGKVLPNDATAWEGVYVPALKLVIGADVLPCGAQPWKEAMAAATSTKLCGAKAERSPSRLEYAQLIDDQLYGPAIDTQFFKVADRHQWEWTSTECAPAGYAWFVYLDDGDSSRGLQSNHGLVRAVRSSQFLDLGMGAGI